MPQKHVVIVGAGPGGLTSGMILAHRGFRVSLFEKKDVVGGRNAALQLGPFKFDTGPTFLMMRFILDEMFRAAGTEAQDRLEFTRLDPMYELLFEDFRLTFTDDHDRMREQIAAHFPGREAGFDRFLSSEKKRFERLYPCLQKPYSSMWALLAPTFLRALPVMSLTQSVFGTMHDYFQSDPLTLCFTFQSKYLGMSPWKCPAVFSMLPYIEHAYGIYHTTGGLSEISTAMAGVLEERGGELHLSTPVSRLTVDGGGVKGVQLEDGQSIPADIVIANADFSQAMCDLVEPRWLRKWHPDLLERKAYSCSTFMLYLGLDKVYDMAHHSIAFAHDYRANLEDIADRMILSEDMSFYVRNASVNDPTLAPVGKSAVYVLVPVPNCRADVDWAKEKGSFRDKVLDAIEARTPMRDIRQHIEQERVITPFEWRDDYDIYAGATFSMAHSISQMLHRRPHNQFEELRNCYLVGGGTHPGSGLPTIYESGRITANMISARFGVPFEPPAPLPAASGE
ncbi:MAG: phytoene desaturase [Planctomycetes bacterium SM23_32]|nr:MAG: phytoene desaturase [Planctomycetes bacterium SM23_32]